MLTDHWWEKQNVRRILQKIRFKIGLQTNVYGHYNMDMHIKITFVQPKKFNVKRSST